MKKLMGILLVSVILSVVLISAATITINLSNAIITPTVSEEVITSETFTYDCDGSPVSAIGNEKDGKYDENDIKSVLYSNCSGTITNVVKEGQTLKQNKHGDFGFDETNLKQKECTKDGKVWDGTCTEPKVVLEV